MSALAPILGDYRLSAPAMMPQPARQTKGVPGPENFEVIVDDYQRRLYGFALRMTGNREDAEEIVQDSFVRAYRALATNVALDSLADPDALLNETQEGPDQPEAIVDRAADMVLVEQALLQLPMHLRAAATLRFVEGRSHPEIAEILNQPIGTVKSHVHRAVRILRRILGPQVGRIVASENSAIEEED